MKMLKMMNDIIMTKDLIRENRLAFFFSFLVVRGRERVLILIAFHFSAVV